jgi:hypothetical protein
MKTPAGHFKDRLLGYARRLRFPKLLAITAALFFVDLFIPDFIPFADELLLGLVTMILASIKQRRRDSVEASRADEAPRLAAPQESESA